MVEPSHHSSLRGHGTASAPGRQWVCDTDSFALSGDAERGAAADPDNGAPGRPVLQLGAVRLAAVAGQQRRQTMTRINRNKTQCALFLHYGSGATPCCQARRRSSSSPGRLPARLSVWQSTAGRTCQSGTRRRGYPAASPPPSFSPFTQVTGEDIDESGTRSCSPGRTWRTC